MGRKRSDKYHLQRRLQRKMMGSGDRVMIAKRAKVYDRKRNLLLKYGLTIEEYAALLEKQGGVCAICRNTEDYMIGETLASLAVDHCHATGVIRGLLCTRCNQMLGKARDNVSVLRSAATYLEIADTGRKVYNYPWMSSDTLLDELDKC